MQGEVHMMAGIAVSWPCIDDPWKLALAIPLAIATHWPIDDINVGPVAKVYHGLGTGWRMIVYNILRVPVILGIIWVLWQNKLLIAPALLAWLALDHEWGLNPWRHGYGLHRRMWFKWLHTEWGLIPRLGFIAMAVAVYAI